MKQEMRYIYEGLSGEKASPQAAKKPVHLPACFKQLHPQGGRESALNYLAGARSIRLTEAGKLYIRAVRKITPLWRPRAGMPSQRDSQKPELSGAWWWQAPGSSPLACFHR